MQRRPDTLLWVARGFLAALCAACGSGDPDDSDGTGTDQPIQGSACATPPSYSEDVGTCLLAATDYQPRVAGSASDSWPACISDDDTYHRIEPSVSTIARVGAYEEIKGLLWGPASAPTREAFIAARVRYEEEQGLGSRVARRFDPHYPAPGGGKCEDPGVAPAYPEHCVGPAVLQPAIVAAFAEGGEGRDRVVNAARIEAALQWFLYVSAIKESTSCADTARDCDSAWAYYAGGGERATPVGLAAEIAALAGETHQRAYDGILAVRCWRNLDNESGTASNLTLRDQAIAQLDRALLRGVALLVRQRFATLRCATGDYQRAAQESLRLLVPLLDRAVRTADAAAADLLRAEIERDPAQVDVDAALAAIDRVFACP